MSNIGGNAAIPRNPSYLRTIPIADAVKAKNKIAIFFGALQDQVTAPKKVVVVEHPKVALWIVCGGVALMIAAVFALVFRAHLPPSLPGVYLGAGGLTVIAIGGIYWFIGKKLKTIVVPSVEEDEDTVPRAIKRQTDHFEAYANAIFDQTSTGGHRALLIGIGKKEWQEGLEIRVRKIGDEHVLASVVHLVAVDIAPPFISVRQMGLDLITGTVFEETPTRQLLSDVLNAAHQVTKIEAAGEWERATKLVRGISELKAKTSKQGDKWSKQLAELESELKGVTLDDAAGDRFILTFANRERIDLIVADGEQAKPPRKIAHPVGGKENLAKAVSTWDLINKACTASKAARLQLREDLTKNTAGTNDAVKSVQDGIGGVQKGITEFQETLLKGVDGLQGQLSSLESVMKEVLAALKAGPPPPPPPGPGNPVVILTKPNDPAVPAYTNGHGASVAASTPDPTAPPPPTQPEPTKVGA